MGTEKRGNKITWLLRPCV